MLVPVFMLVLLGMLEFGFLFDHLLTIQYASREGARVGSALADGGGSPACNTVDNYVIAAVNRVLKSPGSRIDINQVPTITIYKADSSGNEISGKANVWNLTPGAGPIVDGTAKLDFSRTDPQGWSACPPNRQSGDPADSLGVKLTYTYRFVTPLGSILGFFGGGGWSQVTVSDKTVMAINPTSQ
jgi:hypothetical protein